jgi:molybdate transport system regulatory protein
MSFLPLCLGDITEIPEDRRALKKVIVVSADGTKLGKTLLIEKLVREFFNSGLTVTCVKLSNGGHGPGGITCEPGPAGSDTHRFSTAGASTVMFCRFEGMEELEETLASIPSPEGILIFESNSILKLLNPDYHVHICSSTLRKKSAEGLQFGADLTIEGPVCVENAEKIARLVPGMIRAGSYSPVTIGGKHWLNLHGKPLFGEGRMDLLKAVRETGSILQASRNTGIQYKRAWILLRDAEERLGAKLLISDRGGAGGGGSSITPLAETLLAIWEKSEEDFNRMLQGLEV